MKKFISIIAIISILVSALAVHSVAADADIQFSLTDAEGKPGDTVSVDVNVDKNIGTYGMKMFITYDSRCFELLSVTNGEVFTNSEYEASDINNDIGEYVYYAESAGFDNNVKTGRLATLEFKILKAAPNDDYKIAIDFSVRTHSNPALTYRPGGFFFDANDPKNERTVEMTKAGIITVSGSDAVTLPETEPVTTPVTEASTETSPYETEMVTEIVTDEKGETVTDAEGSAVVTEVPIAIPGKPNTQKPEDTTGTETERETEIVYVTDAEGEQVTDVNGDPETTYVYVDDVETPINTVVLVICIAAAAVAIALIVVVVITSRKNGKKDDENNK
jgi:hypothetical protein